MKNMMSAIIALAFLLCSNTLFALGIPDSKITVKVTNEEGHPMEGIRIEMGFLVSGAKGENEVNGFTDSSGSFTAMAASVGRVGIHAIKNGYYESYLHYTFNDIKSSRWLPWNPEVTLVMRKIENPVAMYARDTKMSGPLKIPVVGKEVGFDLIEYDWVEPYGKGKQADFIFKVDKRFVNEDDFDGTMTLTFTNRFDGIQLIKEDLRYGSRLKLPRHAPEKGYLNKLVRTRKRVPGKPIEHDFKDDNNYIFRIRSEEKDGKLVRAMYGKIHGDIKFYPDGTDTAHVIFKYYLNPDYTRNLEFDPTKNLFKGLGSTEQVGLE